MSTETLSVPSQIESVTINLFGLRIRIESEMPQIIDLVKFDFDYYQIAEESLEPANINVTVSPSLSSASGSLASGFGKESGRGADWIKYRNSNQILIEYHQGNVSCLFDQSFKGNVLFAGTDFNEVYEKLYLFIMSRSGEWIESKKLSRIHGFAISYNNLGVIGLTPSGGGKSTLVSELLKQSQTEQTGKVNLYSDDMALIDEQLNLFSFVHRTSLVSIGKDLAEVPKQLQRTFIRAQRTTKTVVSWKFYQDRWADAGSPLTYLVSLKFSKHHTPIIEPLSKAATFKLLVRDMVIGYGLAQVVEFFLVNGIKTLIQKTPLFLSRMLLAIKIAFFSKVKTVTLWQTNSPSENSKFLLQWLEQNR